MTTSADGSLWLSTAEPTDYPVLEGNPEYELHICETDTLSASQRSYAEAQLKLFKDWYRLEKDKDVAGPPVMAGIFPMRQSMENVAAHFDDRPPLMGR